MDQKLDRRSLFTLAAFAGLMPSLLRAQETAETAIPDAGADADTGAAFGPVPASEISEAEEIFLRRPVIVFADNPHDPNYIRQLELLTPIYARLAARDVVLITDTDLANPSEIRKRLRPRGFALVMMDKDWRSPLRRPSPRAGREVLNSIEKMPIARTESLERNPAGR